MVIVLLMAIGTVFVFSASANVGQEFELQRFYEYTGLRHILFFPRRLSQAEPGKRLVTKSDDLPVAAEHGVTGGSPSSAVLSGVPTVRSEEKRAFSVDRDPPGICQRELPTL